jgi:peptidoglycan lytic transglycosylase
MLRTYNVKARSRARSHTAIAAFVATLAVGGTTTEASAKSGHHHRHHVAARHHHHHQVAQDAPTNSGFGSWLNANASIFHATRSFSGMASYYGNESGRRTASGQRFNQNAMTCAHRSLPFGTKLRVTHGSQSVIVTVNDRGPFIRGRVLDLSTGAARAIGLTGAGVGRVTAEVVS